MNPFALYNALSALSKIFKFKTSSTEQSAIPPLAEAGIFSFVAKIWKVEQMSSPFSIALFLLTARLEIKMNSSPP